MLKSLRYGLQGFRELVGSYNKPILGSIVKPKTGLTEKALVEIITAFVEGGVDFIKEDEIMSNSCLPPKTYRRLTTGPEGFQCCVLLLY